MISKAGMLLKNRAMEQAVWVNAIAKPGLETGPKPKIIGTNRREKGPRRVNKPDRLFRIKDLT